MTTEAIIQYVSLKSISCENVIVDFVNCYSQLEQSCKDRLKECKIASKLFELMIVEISWSRVASWILKISGRISALSGEDAKLAYLYFWGVSNISKSSQDLKRVPHVYFPSNFIGLCKKKLPNQSHHNQFRKPLITWHHNGILNRSLPYCTFVWLHHSASTTACGTF